MLLLLHHNELLQFLCLFHLSPARTQCEPSPCQNSCTPPLPSFSPLPGVPFTERKTKKKSVKNRSFTPLKLGFNFSSFFGVKIWLNKSTMKKIGSPVIGIELFHLSPAITQNHPRPCQNSSTPLSPAFSPLSLLPPARDPLPGRQWLCSRPVHQEYANIYIFCRKETVTCK